VLLRDGMTRELKRVINGHTRISLPSRLSEA
jgi:hypothetical protein